MTKLPSHQERLRVVTVFALSLVAGIVFAFTLHTVVLKASVNGNQHRNDDSWDDYWAALPPLTVDEDDEDECHIKEPRPQKIFNTTTGTFDKEDTLQSTVNAASVTKIATNTTEYAFKARSTKQAATFRPGNLNHAVHGVRLSQGLNAKIIARSGRRVQYENTKHGDRSSVQFHDWPDFGACFQDTSNGNPGGWIYVSNSEVDRKGWGGVGAITFDRQGRVMKYDHILSGTTMNCGGGRTPWGTWISCEETSGGRLWQVDPSGKRQPEKIKLGKAGGLWESFAYDVRNRQKPCFFATEDKSTGALARFRPSNVNWDNPWNMLTGSGKHDYLLLHPQSNGNAGRFSWTSNRDNAKNNAARNYPFSEGIDVKDNILFFVCKKKRFLFELDLDAGIYTRHSTKSGLFDGQPDQIQRILSGGVTDEFLFFTEDDGSKPGVFGRNEKGKFFTILQGNQYNGDETTGLAFSPNGKHMYVAYQSSGLLFDVTRDDGLPFYAASLSIKYHGT